MMAAMGLAASLPGIDAQTYRGLEPGANATQAPAAPRSESVNPSAATNAKLKSAPTIDPAEAAMLRSRSARTILRNGQDYIKYQQYEKALVYLREAEKRSAELNPQEVISLRQAIEAAQDGLRSPSAQVGYARSRKPQAGSISIAGRRAAMPPIDSQMLTASAEKPLANSIPAEAPQANTVQPASDEKDSGEKATSEVAKLDPISPDVLAKKLPSAAELASSRTIDSARKRFEAASSSNNMVAPVQEPRSLKEPAPTELVEAEKLAEPKANDTAKRVETTAVAVKPPVIAEDDIPAPLPESPAAVSSASVPAGLPPLEEPVADKAPVAEKTSVEEKPATFTKPETPAMLEIPALASAPAKNLTLAAKPAEPAQPSLSGDDLKAPEVAVPPLPVEEETPLTSVKPADRAKPAEEMPKLPAVPATLPELPVAEAIPAVETKPVPVRSPAIPAEIRTSTEVEKPAPAKVTEEQLPVKLPELPKLPEKVTEVAEPALPELPKLPEQDPQPVVAEPALPELPATILEKTVTKAEPLISIKADDKTINVSSEMAEAAAPAGPDQKTVNGVPVLTPLPDDESSVSPSSPPLPVIKQESSSAESNLSLKQEAAAEPSLPQLPPATPVEEKMPPLPTAKPVETTVPPLSVKEVAEEKPALPELPPATPVEEAMPPLPAGNAANTDTPPLPPTAPATAEEPVKVAQTPAEIGTKPTSELPPLPAEEVAGAAAASAATVADSDPEKVSNRLLSGLSAERRREIEQIARAQVERPGGATPGLSPLGGGSAVSSPTQINNRGMMPGGGSISALDDPLVRLELPRAPSPAEARPIRAILLPEQFDNIKPRQFDPRRKMWASSAVAHYPLYFQDPSLERYGISIEQRLGRAGRKLTYPIDDPTQSKMRNQIATPFFSAGLFALQTATWPLRMIADPPWEAEYDLGYYRPGDRVPEDTVIVPWKGVGPLFKGNKY